MVVGQTVAQGQQIGRIGADEFHLHYTQLRDNVAVKIQFNGTGSGDWVVIDNVDQGTSTTGWTHIVPMVHDAVVDVLAVHAQRQRPRARLQGDGQREDPAPERGRRQHVDDVEHGLDARARVAR